MKIRGGTKMGDEHRRDESTRDQQKENEPVSVLEFFEKIQPGVCVSVKAVPRSRSSVPPSQSGVETLRPHVLRFGNRKSG